MIALDVKNALMDQLRKSSQFEPARKYLGMSRLSECPLRLYRECLSGRFHEVNDNSARRAARGYLFEDYMRSLGMSAGVLSEARKELVADFDDRLRGHTDGETVDGDLLEIKSCTQETFDRIFGTRQPVEAHYGQVQLYMRYGGYRHAVIVYISTETFKFYAVDVSPNNNAQERLIQKAKDILAAIDAGTPPACTCGRCFPSPEGE